MADEEERRPLRHLKFREFENVSGDLTADEIRRLYANKMTELRDNARGNSQALENLKKDKEEEKKELDEQKSDLGKDPRTFYVKMKERYDSEMSALAAEYWIRNCLIPTRMPMSTRSWMLLSAPKPKSAMTSALPKPKPMPKTTNWPLRQKC